MLRVKALKEYKDYSVAECKSSLSSLRMPKRVHFVRPRGWLNFSLYPSFIERYGIKVAGNSYLSMALNLYKDRYADGEGEGIQIMCVWGFYFLKGWSSMLDFLNVLSITRINDDFILGWRVEDIKKVPPPVVAKVFLDSSAKASISINDDSKFGRSVAPKSIAPIIDLHLNTLFDSSNLWLERNPDIRPTVDFSRASGVKMPDTIIPLAVVRGDEGKLYYYNDDNSVSGDFMTNMDRIISRSRASVALSRLLSVSLTVKVDENSFSSIMK